MVNKCLQFMLAVLLIIGLAIPTIVPDSALAADGSPCDEVLILSDAGSRDDGGISTLYWVCLDDVENKAVLTPLPAYAGSSLADGQIPFDVVAAIAASPDGTKIYAINNDADYELGVYDLSTSPPTWTLVGSIQNSTGFVIQNIASAACDPDTGTLYVVSNYWVSLSNQTRMFTVDTTTAIATPINWVTGAGDTAVNDIAFNLDGTLYLYNNSETQHLYTVNPATAAATPTTAVGPSAGFTGLALRNNGAGPHLVGSDHLSDQIVVFSEDDDLDVHYYDAYLNTGGRFDFWYGDMTVGELGVPCPPLEIPLCAGQFGDVGTATVSDNGTHLTVVYQTTGDWIITETHLYVGTTDPSGPDINGNPITSAPGQFPYDDDDASGVPDTMVTYVIPLADIDGYHMKLNTKGQPTGVLEADGEPGVGPCDGIFIATHAVVQREVLCPAIMYGTSLGTGTAGDIIYAIDVSTLTATQLFNTALSSTIQNGPNGNAYDPVNDRLYYSDYDKSSNLYFYDFTNAVNNLAGSLSGSNVACAGWYNGEYYYIRQNSGNLYKVSFNPDGTISASSVYYSHGSSLGSFGDVVINSDGLLYGSSGIGFWSIDLTGPSYTLISSSLPHMQLAFGSDGTLYGHDAGNSNFYTIDPVAGTRTLVGTIDSLKFTDLASGPYEPCVPEEETAWGGGQCVDEGFEGIVFDFPGANWATYFEYHICCANGD